MINLASSSSLQKIKTLIIILCAGFTGFAQQIEKSVLVLNQAQEPVEAYAINQQNNTFFFANEAGLLNVTGRSTDSIVFTCLGYLPLTIAISNCSDTVALYPERLQLEEAVVVDKSALRLKKLGNSNQNLECTIEGIIKPNGTNDRIGLLVNNHTKGFIKDVSFYVTSHSSMDSKMRINIYTKRKGEFELLHVSKPFTISCKACWQVCHLQEENIYVKGDILVVVEWLFTTNEVQRFIESRYPVGFGIGLSKNLKYRACKTYSYNPVMKWYRTCCGTEESMKTPLTLMLKTTLIKKKLKKGDTT